MKFAEAAASVAPVERHPQGWEPGITWSSTGGEIIAKVGADSPEMDPALWALLIEDWGLDPAITEVVPDSVQIRAWDAQVGAGQTIRAKYYRAAIRMRRNAQTPLEVAELHRVINKRTIRKATPADGDMAFVVNLSDWQIGKGEGGGSAATVARIIDALDAAVLRLRELRRCGRKVSTVVLMGMGDLAEGCFGHYPSQPFTVDMSRREQLQTVRMLIARAIDLFADLADRVVLGAVPGNHGENRSNGKAVTVVSDNDDLAVVEQVGEALAQNPARFGHVEVVLADGLVLTLDLCGVVVGWTHMHQGPGSGQAKIEAWWRAQVMGRQPISDAQILNTAHFHHFLLSESTGRTVIQQPAMDGGSRWWTDKTGQSSPTGMVTYLAGAACGQRGWQDLAIL